jgi:hypothetical protein
MNNASANSMRGSARDARYDAVRYPAAHNLTEITIAAVAALPDLVGTLLLRVKQ